ncbi:MAG TPA: hypothetical protein VKQ30_06235 [Ktedonobacterales bacterium]|nr:hypothetical protein [Ktedonobacterales bacterium]
MRGWQSELDELLSQLHVSLEPGRLPSSLTSAFTSTDGALDVDIADDGTDASVPLDLEALPADEMPVDGDEVNAVSRELESTVRRVIHMARVGQMESSLRDDVVFVLQALTRPNPHERSSRRHREKIDDGDQEWQLATAAAVLRFCRIVLHLTDALSRDAGS